MRALVAIEVLVAIGCHGAAPHGAPSTSSARASPAAAQVVSIERQDRTVASDPGVTIAFREVIARGREDGVPVVLVHGAGAGGSAFDLPVPGYSMAEDLARAGHPAYAIDVRGWGGSTRPAVLDAPAGANPPAVGSDEAVRDIAAVVAWVRARWQRPVAVVGWATGGHWAGMFAARQPEAVSHLVMLNAIYGTPGPWSLRARLEDPDRPGQLSKSVGAYTLRDAAALLRTWDTNIPVEDKASWRDPRVAEAYAATAIDADATASQRTPPSARVPAGPLRDSHLLASGTKLWEARDVRAATLVVRSELDFWSRPEDVEALQRELVHARRVETVILTGATHVAFLDRPERGRAQWMAVLVGFLARS